MKILTGDEIKVIRGKDKGKTGKVERAMPKEVAVLVTGLNQFKKHVKGKAQNQKSEIVTITKPIALSNVILICPKCHVATRVGYKTEDAKKKRICRKCEQII